MVVPNKITANIWEIPKTVKKEMNVPVHIYSSDRLMRSIDEGVIKQAINVATLPGVVEKVSVMPDGHWGYGFPIGGVAAMDQDVGVISPGGIGFDINCGMRLIQTNLTKKDVLPKIETLVNLLFDAVPTGVGVKGNVKLNPSAFDEIMQSGVDWVIENGYGWKEDKNAMEEKGTIKGANPEFVSKRAIKRGISQLGTLGSGNHFLEIQVASKHNIHDIQTAKAFGIDIDEQVVIMIHCGSRAFGHQIASDYGKRFLENMHTYNLKIKDRELAAAPIKSRDGEEYFSAMACGANMAFANRSIIMHNTRKVFEKVFKTDAEDLGMNLTYDVCHNIAKFENHRVNDEKQELLVHRKGATRAFAPGEPDLAQQYKTYGQPVIIGGSMETGSYILAGQKSSMTEAFGSCAHGSGRVMSRSKAKRQVKGEQLQKAMKDRGIYVKAASIKGLAEEAGLAYKDISAVVKSCKDAGLAKPIVKLLPIGNIKG